MPLRVEVAGTGRPILMLHGNPLDHRVLTVPLEPWFRTGTGHRRIYVDLPGFGESPASPAVNGSDDMVEVVERLVDEIAPGERLLVIGQSFGAYLAEGLIARHPHRYAGVALICPMVVAERARRDRPDRVVIRTEPGLLDAADAEAVAAFREDAVIEDATTWQFFQTALLPAIRAADPDAVRRIEERYAFERIDLAATVFDGPSLVVTGRQDSTVGYRDAWRVLDRYPRAAFAVLDGAGHNAHVERKDVVLSLIADWLARVDDEEPA
ncbi:MAG: alpha/beta hydrolase [Chloroflexi bacterium]|nr:alpha/beta hydrolase [Chloroflexota bacterium]